MKKISKLFSGLFLASFMALGLATIGSNDSNHLVVRDVLAEDVSKDVTGKVVRRANGGEANGLISEVKAQVSQPKDDKISIRFIAGLDSYRYETAKFNINVEDANKSFEGVVTTAYTAVEVGNGVLTASEVFGEGYNYLIAYTINGVPSSVWNSSFEVTASIQENAESEFVVSEVSNKVINEMLKADNNTVMVFNAEDLKEIANNVNNGSNRYKGKTVKLMKDIDLANEEWTPIGNGTYSFQGNFEGNGRTISNLKVTDNPSGSNKGLFGFTTGGKISNLVVENAEVKGRLNVGVVAGTPYTSSYENITVKGLIKVDGMSYVGGVFGKNVYANLTNITVDAAEGSYVKADSYENGLAYRTYVGGVAGFMGEGTHEVKNVTSNIDVYGTVCDVGGLVGIAHEGNKFTNVTITGNVYLNGVDTDASSYLEVGGLAGVWMNKGRDVVFTNCSFTGEVEVTTSVEVELPTRFYYDGLVGKPYNDTTSNKLYINGVDVTDLKPVAPEPKTLEVDHVECYGDWFMKVFLKYDGFTFEDINRSTIVVSMSNNSAPSTGEQVGYAGNFFIRIDANERGAENKTTGTSFTAAVAFELNDGTPCSAEFKVHNGTVVDEFPTPEPEQPEPEEPEVPDTPVVPGETKTIEINRIECYGDWFMKVFFKYDGFAFADINASTIKVTMSNNSAATVGEKVGYGGEFMIRFDANERGNENKTVGTAYVATIEFELNDGTKYVAEFNVSKGAIVDELPTPEQPGEEPETPVELPTKPEGALDLVLGGNWNPHGDGFLVFGWTNAGLTNDIIAEYKVTAIIDGVESAFTFNRIDGAVHAFFRNTDLGVGIGGASYILVVEFTTTDGTVYFAAVNVVNGSRA